MMMMLWVTMGMYVPFVAPSLTLRRCSCVTSVSCNIVRIALTRIHINVNDNVTVTMSVTVTPPIHPPSALFCLCS